MILKLLKKKTKETLSHINIGSGKEITIKELAETIKTVIGFQGKIKFDNNKPDGTPRKLLNIKLLNSLGWFPSISLIQGIKLSYLDFIKNVAK